MAFRNAITFNSLQGPLLVGTAANRMVKTFSRFLFSAAKELIGIGPGVKQPSLNGQSGSRSFTIQVEHVHPALFLNLTHQALKFSSLAPDKYHDLMAMPQHVQLHKGHVLDIGESLATRELAEITYRAARMYIKITPKGIGFIKKQEKELQPYNTNFYSVA